MSRDNISSKVAEKSRHEKERLQKAKATDQAHPKCPSCGKYRINNKNLFPQCFGHGAGSGSGSSKGEEKKEATPNTLSTLSRVLGHPTPQKKKKADLLADRMLVPSATRRKDAEFKIDAISELKNLLLVLLMNDKNTLFIELQCDPSKLSPELREQLTRFASAILAVLDDVKKAAGINDACYTLLQDKKGNFVSLSITLPTAELYHTFIQQLAKQNLLPKQTTVQEAKEKLANDQQPAGLKFPTRPRSPRDGYKPKGY